MKAKRSHRIIANETGERRKQIAAGLNKGF